MHSQQFPGKRTEIHDFELPTPLPEPTGNRRASGPMSLPVALVVSAAIVGGSGVAAIALIPGREFAHPAVRTGAAEPSGETVVTQRPPVPEMPTLGASPPASEAVTPRVVSRVGATTTTMPLQIKVAPGQPPQTAEPAQPKTTKFEGWAQNFTTGRRGEFSVEVMDRDGTTGRIETYVKFTGAQSSEGNLVGSLLDNGQFKLEGTVGQKIGDIFLNRVAITMQGRLQSDTIRGNYFVALYFAPETKRMLEGINPSFMNQMTQNSMQHGQFSIAKSK